ncbi:TPA: polymorphic toxin type 50 domain-containing protein [Staphylococcus aureus]
MNIIIRKIIHLYYQVIDYKKIIGKSYVNGKYIETKLGKVHYSKTGFHVVPYIKKE